MSSRVVIAQSTAASAAAHPEVIAGCYRLDVGPWSRESTLGPPAPTVIVRLDTLSRRPELPEYLAAERVEPAEFVPPGDVRAQWRRPAAWRIVGADSVEIIAWSTGTEAESFHGRRVGSVLRGVMRRTSDAIPVDPVTRRIVWEGWPWAVASAVPVRCP